MNFSDLVKKLEELGNPPADQQEDPSAIKPTNAPQQEPVQNPNERPIPGQQPNLGPKTVQQPPQQAVQPVAPQPAPQQQQQQQPNDGMAAAILQALGQLKQQNPLTTATTSQSVAAQKAQAQAQPLQQTNKPGEPTEDIEVNEETAKQPDAKNVANWIYSLNQNPDAITHPNWRNLDPESKRQIIGSKDLNSNSRNYIEAHRKLMMAKRNDPSNDELINQLEGEKKAAWKAHNTTETPKKEEPKQEPKAEPAVRSPLQSAKPTADQITQQERLTQELGKAYANATDPKQKEVALKAYQDAGEKLKQMQGNTEPAGDKEKPSVEREKRTWTPGTLGRGTVDPKVGELQDKLNKMGFVGADGKPLTVDNNFGPNTQHAVKQLQQQLGVKDDGAFGNVTKTALEKNPISPIKRADVSSEPVTNVEVPNPVNAEPPKSDAVVTPVANNPAKVEPQPAEKPKSTYQPVKQVDTGNGKKQTILDPFNLMPNQPKQEIPGPGEGPAIRQPAPVKDAEPKPVKEMSLQSVVDEMLYEDKVAKEDATSTASKWATKSAKLAPWVGNAAKAGNIALSASDIADYTKKGDKLGAGIASAALAADAIGTVFPPASWASFALDMANAGRDVYLKQTGQDYKDPDEKQMQAKEELSNIVRLTQYKADKK